jgi:hypothetical protein
MKREFTYELDEGIRSGGGRMDEERVYIRVR